ncbi:hypothetical protein [Actinophytocola sp.]|uniref:hypothetical protein n=1 Tax=Actinophytocola sp. TaxID=1872138 RepID=UPI002ED5C3DB
MTDSRRTGAAPRPPLSVDVLADLHAGALDAKQSAALWAQVNRDPEAQAALAALDGVRQDLKALGDRPVEPMPAHFAAQLDAAIAAEAAKSRPAQPGMAPVVDMAGARRKRNRRMGWAAGILTTAAAAVAVTFVALPGEEAGSPVAQDGATTGETAPMEIEPEDLGASISGLQGKKDYGPLGDEQGLKDCLAEHDIETTQVIGVREVMMSGNEGVAALLAGGEGAHRLRLVIVDPECTTVLTNKSLG